MTDRELQDATAVDTPESPAIDPSPPTVPGTARWGRGKPALDNAPAPALERTEAVEPPASPEPPVLPDPPQAAAPPAPAPPTAVSPAPIPPWERPPAPSATALPDGDEETTVVTSRRDFPPPPMRDELPGPGPGAAPERPRLAHPGPPEQAHGPGLNGSRPAWRDAPGAQRDAQAALRDHPAPPQRDHPAPQRPPVMGPPPGDHAPATRAFSRPGWGQEPAPRRADPEVAPRRSEPEPAPRRAEPDRWAHQPPPAPSSASPGNWSYVDSIRTSELVPSRKIPPGRGWRRAVYRSTFGLINFGRSPDERRLAELEAKIRSLLRGRYKIGVLGKGGTGKSTLTAGIGSIFAELRQDDRVVAIDADPAFGKLGARIDPNARGSYWELAADDYLHTFADVRSRVGNNAAGLFVLAGESATARRRLLDPAIYREATARLDHHFTISLVDCGSVMDSPVLGEVLRDLDALVVVSSPWVDGASAAGQIMEWLANHGYTGLLHRTVVVLNDSDGHADKHTRQVLVEQFSSRGQAVFEVPYDPHLRPGGLIDVHNDIDKVTRRRLIEIAASIAEHFAATTDGPRERR